MPRIYGAGWVPCSGQEGMEALREDVLNLLKTPAYAPKADFVTLEALELVQKDLAAGSEDKDEPLNSLDQLFFDVLARSTRESGRPSLGTLIDWYHRSQQGGNAKSVLGRNLRKFALSYATLVVTVPGLIEGEEESWRVLLSWVARSGGEGALTLGWWQDWLGQVASREGRGQVQQVLEVVLGTVGDLLCSGQEEFDPLSRGAGVLVRVVLGTLVQLPLVSAFIVEDYSRFLRVGAGGASTGVGVEDVTRSFIGSICAMQAVDHEHFGVLRRLLPANYHPPLPGAAVQAAFDTLHTCLHGWSEFTHQHILLPLVRVNRQRVLEHLALMARANAGRSKMHVDAGSVNGDGLVQAAWALLLRLTEPFTVAGDAVMASKLSLIDGRYCWAGGSGDILGLAELDRVGFDGDSFRAWRAGVLGGVSGGVGGVGGVGGGGAVSGGGTDGAASAATAGTDSGTPYNFITQVFFISLAFMRIGPLRLVQTYGQTSREFVELEGQMKRLEEMGGARGPLQERLVARMRARMEELADMRLCLDVHARDTWAVRGTVGLVAFAVRWMGRARGQLAQGRALPEALYEGVLEWLLFMTRMQGAAFWTGQLGLGEQQLLVRFCVELLLGGVSEEGEGEGEVQEQGQRQGVAPITGTGTGTATLTKPTELGPVVKNPYLRAKVGELLFMLASEEGNVWEQVVIGGAGGGERVCRALVTLYVQVEALGTSTAFYDKFSIRYHLARGLQRLVDGPGQDVFEGCAEGGPMPLLLRFLNLVVGDATYLLDEAFGKLSEIRSREREAVGVGVGAVGDGSRAPGQQGHQQGSTAPHAPPTPQDQQMLAQTERQCESLLALGEESLGLLAGLALRGGAAVQETLLRPELLHRLAAMLNFNLALLAGPRCSALKVAHPERYRFNPRRLLQQLLAVYLALADRPAFVRALLADERSFSVVLMDAALAIMRRVGMDAAMVAGFMELRVRVCACGGDNGANHASGATSLTQDTDANVPVPEEFLDPILFTVMTDPVLLPSSRMLLDRATITAHLLNDAHDPFNRQPLSLADVLPCPADFKARLAAWHASCPPPHYQ